MKLLVTSANSRLGQIAGKALSATHDVTLTDLPQFAAAGDGVVANDLNHDEAMDDLVTGMDVVIFPGIESHTGDASWLIDHHTRRSYNVLRACVDAGVPHAIYLSTLQLLDDYEERLTVSERWRPLPSTEDEILAVHLGEYVFREYAREEPISTTILRLGFPIIDGDRAGAESVGSAAVATDDVGLAINATVEAGGDGYRLLHIQSPVPNARYLLGNAELAIGFPEQKESLAGEGAAR
ncbi:MAG: NAD(P)-dependent oxidoreductase [Chloroflexi bacterium]|nr:NAD(P)-dependent oxidoreductase [Chloroflexota bacterium]